MLRGMLCRTCIFRQPPSFYSLPACQSRIIRTPPKRRYFRALCRIRLSPYVQYEQSRLRQKSSKIATFWLPASLAARLSLKTRRKTEVRIILGWHTDIPDAYAVFSIIMQKSAGKSKPKINSRKKIKQKTTNIVKLLYKFIFLW